MKVAFVNTEYLPVPPTRGGAVEEWIDKIANHLKGHEISVFSFDREAQGQSQTKDHVHYFWYRPGWLGKLLLSTYRLPFKKDDSKWLYFPYSFWCARMLKKIQADIIHIHNRPHFVWIIRKMNPRAKIILHLHQLSAFDEEDFWTKEFMASVDLFVGCSHFIADELMKKYSVDKNKTSVFYNGLDLAEYPILEKRAVVRSRLRQENDWTNKMVVLYVGRLVENKGVHHLVQAVRNLVLKGATNLQLVVCGARGYASREITPYIQKLYNTAYEVNENITFTGFVSHEKMLNYYAMADVVMIPSEVHEGFCLVTIEGMASGIPVAASNRGGMPEIVRDGKTGTIIGEPSVENIEKYLSDFLSQPERFHKYIAVARKSVEECFTWEKVSRTVEDSYKELVAHAKG